MKGWKVNNELERCRRKQSWPNLRYYPGIRLEVPRKTTKKLTQECRYPGSNLNTGPPEYKAGVLTTRPRRLVSITKLQTTSSSSFPFSIVSLQRRGCLVAPFVSMNRFSTLCGWLAQRKEWWVKGEYDRVSKLYRLGLTYDLTTRDLWRSRRWARKWEFCLFIPVGLQKFFYMP
jgi:hypothetical protein